MIKIAFIIDTIATPAAGTEKQLLMLINEIDKIRFKPYLICLQNSEWLQSNDLPFDVHILEVGSLLSSSFLRGLLRIKKMHKTERFDIIQTFFIDGNIFGTIAARIMGCRRLISSRRNIGYWHNRVHTTILRLFAMLTPYYLCNSRAAQEQTIAIEKINPNKLQVIYNGLELKRFESINNEMRRRQRDTWRINDDEIVIGAIANLRPVKNIALMIESAADLVKEFSTIRFIVVGEGALRESLQDRINELGLSNTFLLVGRLDNILEPLAAFDIAVIPSLSESFSNSLIEYMAARLPIVSSDVGGNSEAIEHNKTGLLFSLENRMGLSNCIRRFIQDKSLGDKLAQNAFLYATRNFSAETMIRKHQSYYEDIMCH